MKNKLKILVVSTGSMVPPYHEVSGFKAIYELQRELGKKAELHILNFITTEDKNKHREWLKTQEAKYGLHYHLVIVRIVFFRRLYSLWAHVKLLYATIKLILTEDFDLIHEYSAAPIFFRKSFFYKIFKPKIKIIFTLAVNTKGPLASPKLGGKGKSTNLIICPSRFLYNELLQAGYPEEKLREIPFGVDLHPFKKTPESFELREELGIPKNKKIVTYIGLLDKRKGADIFLQAIPEVARKFPFCTFLFISSPINKGLIYKHDEAKKQYSQWLKNAERNIIFLEGKQNIAAILKISDIFAYPISTMHGILNLPLTLLEAIIAEKAIITTDIEPMKSIFSNNKNAILIKPGDSGALSQVVLDLLINPKKAKLMSQEVKKLINHFDLDICAQKLFEDYLSLTP